MPQVEPKIPDTRIETAKKTPSVVYGEPPKPSQVKTQRASQELVTPPARPEVQPEQHASLATAAKAAGDAVVTGLFFKTVSEGKTPALMVAGTRVKN